MVKESTHGQTEDNTMEIGLMDYNTEMESRFIKLANLERGFGKTGKEKNGWMRNKLEF